MFKLPALRNISHFPLQKFVRGYAASPIKSCALRCKVIIVVGGGDGIGLALARAFVENGAFAVVLADKDEPTSVKHMKDINKKYGENKTLFQKADAINKKELEGVFECTRKRFQRLDAVVNVAGMWNDPDHEKIMWANTVTTVNGTELGYHYMAREHFGRGGDILNVIHIDALGPRFAFPVGSASQNFQLGYTKAMADDNLYKKTGVRIMGLLTGLTLTRSVSDIRFLIDNREKDVSELADLTEVIVKVGSEPIQCGPEVGQAAVEALKSGIHGQFYIAENHKFCKTKYDLSHLLKRPAPPPEPKKSTKK